MRLSLRSSLVILALAAAAPSAPALTQAAPLPAAPALTKADGEREVRVTGEFFGGSFFYQLHPDSGECLSVAVLPAQLAEAKKRIGQRVTIRARAVSYDYFFKSGRYDHITAEWGPAYLEPEPDWMNMAGCGRIAVAWEFEK
ncbi:MAG: hypothetical protein ACAH11_03900 [Sphingomonas sp.]